MSNQASRREMLNLVASRSKVIGDSSAAAAPAATNHYQVRSYQVSLAAAGAIKVRLTAAPMAEVFDIELPDAETRGHFMKLLEIAVGGRGRMSIDVDRDTNAIQTFVLDVP